MKLFVKNEVFVPRSDDTSNPRRTLTASILIATSNYNGDQKD
jgi:hypothetical protein